MCGLTGFIDYRPATRQSREAIVSAMAQTLFHRGPDDGGAWVDADAGVALGFRRLSIIDLSPLGHQPMVIRERSLRHRLQRRDLQFQGHQSAAVAGGRYVPRPLRHGDPVGGGGVGGARARRLPLAKACSPSRIWDREERNLTLARDRAGIKPLYWGLTPDGMYCCSARN